MQLKEEELSLKDTLLSGQCFRFSQEEDYWIIKSGSEDAFKSIRVSQNDLSPIIEDPYWRNYFDLDTDYEKLKKEFSKISPLMAQACSYAPGIRILNQDPWEALCSFVISQNNNIKRIMTIIEKLCSFYSLGTFPSASSLANAKEEDLRSLGLGFRAPYIINTARAIYDKAIDLEALRTMDIEEARSMLMRIKGIGPKVADCALLFGLHRLDCFPMDVWMKKVMAKYFPTCDKTIFGPCCGVAQQYLFHYARTSSLFDAQ